MDKRELRRLSSNITNNTDVQSIIDNDDSLVRWETFPNRVSYFINDMPYLTTAPVSSVNGQTGSVILNLFSGNYSDLLGKPTIPTALSQLSNDTGYITTSAVTSVNGLTGNVTLTIPAAQVQSNWSATTGLGVILNKPTIPTLLSQLTNDLGFITASALRPVVTYKGTTNTSGNFTVTYATPYTLIPDVQVQLIGGTVSQVARVVASTTTGFTVQVTNRASVTLLSVEVLLAATTVVSGASVSVLVTTHI